MTKRTGGNGLKNSCVAHRGASGLAPENTMAAIRKAMSFPFVGWIELDVQLSRDGIPVVIHDDTLQRTAKRKGRVADYDAEQLTATDVGGWFSPAFAGETIPLLETVIEETKGRCRLNIELKTYGGRYPGMEKAVVDLLRKHGIEREAVITSFDPTALRKVRELSADVKIGLIIDGAPPFLVQELKTLDAAFLSIGHVYLNRQRMALFSEAGLQVMAWTVNDPQRMRRLAAISPDIMICTNYPDRYAAALGKQPRPGWLKRLFGRSAT